MFSVDAFDTLVLLCRAARLRRQDSPRQAASAARKLFQTRVLPARAQCID